MEVTYGLLIGTATTFGFCGLFKAFSISNKNLIEHISKAKSINDSNGTPNKPTLTFLVTKLFTTNPIILNGSETKWLSVSGKIYSCKKQKKIDIDEYNVGNNTIKTVNAYDTKDLEYRDIEPPTAIPEVHATGNGQTSNVGISLTNIIPNIRSKFETSEEVFLKKRDQSEPSFLGTVASMIPSNIYSNSDGSSRRVEMQAQYIGDVIKRQGLKQDDNDYLIIGKFNGSTFMNKDPNIIIKRNTTLDEYIEDLENKKKFNNTVGNAFGILGSGLFVGAICNMFIVSRL